MKDIVVACDVGNVIITADHHITYRALRAEGVEEKRVHSFFDSTEYGDFSRGKISSKEFCDTLRNKYFKTEISDSMLRDAHNQHITGVDWDVIHLIEKINPIPLIFLTDTNIWQTEREKELIDLKKYSNTIIRSYKIHSLKRDADYYDILKKTADVLPNQLILIDDNLEIIEQAKRQGLRTITFTSATQLSNNLQTLLNTYGR